MTRLPEHTVTRVLEFDAAHRITLHESKCASLHGHRYRVEVVCAGELDDLGRVIDFGAIKAKLGAWIDAELDHNALLRDSDMALIALVTVMHKQLGRPAPFIMYDEPTAENIAEVLYAKAVELLHDDGLRVVRVRVWETPNCMASFER